MKSIYICLMGVVFANHKIDEITAFYDGLADIATNVAGEYQCETAIADQLDLLCNGFKFCQDTDIDGNPECMDKDTFKTEALDVFCGRYDTFEFEYEIDTDAHQNAYNHNSHISLTFTLKFKIKDDPCTFTVKDKHVINLNDNGLITKWKDVQQIGDIDIDCPSQPNEYQHEEEKPLSTAVQHKDIPVFIKKFYKLFAQIGEDKKGNCLVKVDEMMDLCDDSYTWCVNGHCITKDEYQKAAIASCGTYDDIQYTLTVTDDAYSSISFVADFTLKSLDGCTEKQSNQATVEYNDRGLITKRTTKTISDSKICPQDANGYTQFNEIDQILAFYDGWADIGTNVTGEYQCESTIADQLDLLSDGFRHCTDYYQNGSIICSDKDAYLNTLMERTCGLYDTFEYEIDIDTLNKTYDDNWQISLTFIYEIQLLVVPYCTVTGTAPHVINLDGNGLITNFYEGMGRSNVSFCSPIAESDNASTTVNKAVIINVLDNDYDYDSDRDELIIVSFTSGKKGSVEVDGDRLKYIPNKDECGGDTFIYTIADVDGLTDSTNVHIDIECPQSNVYGAETPAPDAFDYDNKEKENQIYAMHNQWGRVLCKKESDKMSDINMKQRFCDNMEYEAICNDDSYDCTIFKQKLHGRQAFLDYFGHYENLFDDAIVIGDDSMLTIKYRKGQCHGEFKERFDIEYDSYNGCISKWTQYVDHEEISITDKEGSTDCDNSLSKFIEKLEKECTFDEVYGDENENEYIPETKPDTSDYDGLMVREYKNLKVDVAVGDDVLYGGYMLVTNTKELEYIASDILELTDRIRKESSVDWASITLINAYTKDISENRIRYRCELGYVGPMPEPVIQKDGSVTQTGGGLALGYIEYDVVLTNKNDEQKEKENKIYAMNNQFARVLCKKQSDKMNDINMKQRFCVNMQYEAVCNNDDNYDCNVFKKKLHGRRAFLDYYGQYENLFDEAIFNDDDRMLTIKYRKGQCQGELKQRIDIEYDSYNKCISKYTEYVEEISITNKEGSTDCDNSASKFFEKLEKECIFDDEEKPETGYGSGSGLDPMDNYNNKEEDASGSYTSTGTDGMKRLVKMEREDKLKLFYEAAFECRLKQNQGNTQIFDKFMSYLDDSCKLCVFADDGKSQTCYTKDRIREMMSDRYSDDNESIDYQVDITYNDGDNIHSKCTSRRRKPNGCIVIKEEYDQCSFNSDGSIKEFKIMRSNRRTRCNDNNGYEQE